VSLFGYSREKKKKKGWMKKLVIEVNGVGYECVSEINKVAEAVGMDYDYKVDLLAFRDSVEVNGNRYVLTRIATFGRCKVSLILIPNNVQNIGKRCFDGCKSLYEVLFESDSKLIKIGNFGVFIQGWPDDATMADRDWPAGCGAG
jgi:hypothetical protein